MILGGLPSGVSATPAVVYPHSYSADFSHGQDEFAFVQVEWPDLDAVQIRYETISHAKKILAHLPLSTENPHISVSADGEIGFSWVKGSSRFEAMVDPEDHLVWVVKLGRNFAPGGDILVNSPVGRDIFYAALRDFYGQHSALSNARKKRHQRRPAPSKTTRFWCVSVDLRPRGVRGERETFPASGGCAKRRHKGSERTFIFGLVREIHTNLDELRRRAQARTAKRIGSKILF